MNWCTTSDIATLCTRAEIDALAADDRGPADRRRRQADACIDDLLAAAVTIASADGDGTPVVTLRLDDLPRRAIADLLDGEALAMHATAERLICIAVEISGRPPPA